MARFLSPEWLDALAAAAGRAEVDPAAALVVEQAVEDVRYTVRLVDGRVTVAPGGAADADVTSSTDRATAAALARGELATADAFSSGRLRIAGDVAALLRAAPALAALDDAFVTLRTDTTY